MKEKDITSLTSERQRRLFRSSFEDAREFLFNIKNRVRDNVDDSQKVFDFLKESLKGRIRASKEKEGYLEACRDEEVLSGYFSYSAETISILASRIGIDEPFSDEEKKFYEDINVKILSKEEARAKVKLVLCGLSEEKSELQAGAIDIAKSFENLKSSQSSSVYERLYESLSYILFFKIARFDCSLHEKYLNDHNLLMRDIQGTVKNSFESDEMIKEMLSSLIQVSFKEKPTDEFTSARLKNEIITKVSEEIFNAIVGS